MTTSPPRRAGRRNAPLALATLVLAAIIAVGLVAALGSTGLPRVPTELNTPRRDLAIRPGRIDYSGDGTGILSGGEVTTLESSLRWSSWTSRRALGRGDDLISHCQASGCLPGQIRAYPIRLEAWRPAGLHGQRVFTRLTIWYTARPPAGVLAEGARSTHYTFSARYDGGWSFGPPSAQGYCVDTYGGPQAAGCANIDALPSGG